MALGDQNNLSISLNQYYDICIFTQIVSEGEYFSSEPIMLCIPQIPFYQPTLYCLSL